MGISSDLKKKLLLFFNSPEKSGNLLIEQNLMLSEFANFEFFNLILNFEYFD